MKFETLEDAEAAYNDLESSCRMMFTSIKAFHIVLSSLIATHPSYEQFQLHLTTIFEGPGMRVFGEGLPPHEAEALRSQVEHLQQTAAWTKRIDPLQSSGLKP